jgi:hypothetical protein
MSYCLFLDDKRNPIDCRDYPGDGSLYETEDWVVVRSVSDFKKTIREMGVPKLISFDYELNDNDGDGLLCAGVIWSYCMSHDFDVPKWLVHSAWPGIYGKFKEIFEKYENT